MAFKNKRIRRKGKKTQEADSSVHSGVDTELISKIAPLGGISFKPDRYNISGDGYTACIHVLDYPNEVHRYWGYELCKYQGCVVTVDVITPDQNTVKSNINKSIMNQTLLTEGEKDVVVVSQNTAVKQKYYELIREIQQQQVIVKYIHVRIFVSAASLEELDRKIISIQTDLKAKNYRGYVLVGENMLEYRSMMLPASRQYDEVRSELSRTGQPVTTPTLGDFFPFIHTKLVDPHGTFMGMTDLNGVFIFDQFTKTDKRTAYDAFVVGKKGSGKSTLMKKIIEDNIIKGNLIRGLDPSGEYSRLVREYGGRYIRLDGTEGTVNPLEILSTADTEGVSMQRHLSKVRIFYELLKAGDGASVNVDEAMEVENLLGRLYEKWGFPMEGRYTGFESSKYPVFSDLLTVVRDELAARKEAGDLSPSAAQRLESIELTINNIVSNYGSIFNTHTTIDDISDEQIVYFDLSNIISMNSSVRSGVLFNAIMLCWDNCLWIGKRMYKAFNEGTIEWEDITRGLIVIDEAHNIINTNQKNAVSEIQKIVMEDRKYFIGLLYASPSLSSFVTGASRSGEEFEKIMSLFNETQYKFLMRQDENTMNLIDEIFRDSIPGSYKEAIPTFGVGDCLVHISGEGCLRFNVYVNNRQKKIFGGGA